VVVILSAAFLCEKYFSALTLKHMLNPVKPRPDKKQALVPLRVIKLTAEVPSEVIWFVSRERLKLFLTPPKKTQHIFNPLQQSA